MFKNLTNIIGIFKGSFIQFGILYRVSKIRGLMYFLGYSLGLPTVIVPFSPEVPPPGIFSSQSQATVHH